MSSSSTSTSGSAGSSNVWVVDDDEKSGRLASDVLAFHGYAIQRAGTGERALELAASGPAADLVMLDIQLPGIDGVATLLALRTLPGWSEVPVIAMTASVMPADRHLLTDAGFNGFIAKPLAVRDLVELVRASLARASG